MIFLFHKKYIQRDIVIFNFFRNYNRRTGVHYTTIWYNNIHFLMVLEASSSHTGTLNGPLVR